MLDAFGSPRVTFPSAMRAYPLEALVRESLMDRRMMLYQTVDCLGWVNLRHSQPCPEYRLLGVKRTKSARKRTSASEYRLVGDKRTYRRHGADPRI